MIPFFCHGVLVAWVLQLEALYEYTNPTGGICVLA